MCIFVYLVCCQCENFSYSESQSYLCRSHLCGRFEFYIHGFPMEMAFNADGNCGICLPYTCDNMYQNFDCPKHVKSEVITSDKISELISMFETL